MLRGHPAIAIGSKTRMSIVVATTSLWLTITVASEAGPLADLPFVCVGVRDEDLARTGDAAKATVYAPTHVAALVIYAKFAGEAPEDSLAPTYAKDLFNPDLFGILSHFYHRMSFGEFEIQGSTLARRYSSVYKPTYYVQADSTAILGNFGQFNREILSCGDRDMDFGQFDNDGADGLPNSGDDDGVVDHVFINLLSVVPGFSKANATGVASLGSKEAYVTEDSSASGGLIQVRAGSTQRTGAFAYTVGVMAHELGHRLGLPDLYDAFPGDDRAEDSAGIGRWGLMGHGATGWHDNDRPTPFCA